MISRQVLSSKQWLTIEDWLESGTHLCPLAIRHEGRLERCPETSAVRVCFSSRSLGDGVLEAGANQESIQVSKYTRSSVMSDLQTFLLGRRNIYKR